MQSQRIDGLVGRMVHGLTMGGGTQERSAADSDETILLERVEDYLAAGIALKEWFDRTDPAEAYAEKFELSRTFNRPESSYGFFDEVLVHGESLPIMGNVQDMFYDQPRIPTDLQERGIDWLRGQIREFVLRYFMRVSSFRNPEAYVTDDPALRPSPLERVAWCPREDIRRQGFGFSQLFYKLRDTGEIGKFSDADAFEIVDLREIGRKYAWIILKVRIFDFGFKFKPAGVSGPEIVFGLDEESYLVLSEDFVEDVARPEPGIIGRYSLGYAFIKSPAAGIIAYGPGQFDAAFESIQFRVHDTGEIRVRMVFVVNRPRHIALVQFDPLGWGYRLADTATFGIFSEVLRPFKRAWDQVAPRLGSFDPVYTYIRLLNAVTAGWAENALCISRTQLDKDFLLQHYMQHYQAVTGSLLTWRQIYDWLDAVNLPRWVVTGVSS